MIDMRRVYLIDEYKNDKNKFTNSKNWNDFKNSFLIISKRCPFCETKITKSTADIDHYRPQHIYPFLKYTISNYILICKDCNGVRYKGGKFPIYKDLPNAKNENELNNEKPLLINPTQDDIFEFFELKFLITKSSKKILALIPKDKNINSYKYQKAKESIDIYGLGDCDENTKVNIDECRIELLEDYYETFFEYAKSMYKLLNNKIKTTIEKREVLREINKFESKAVNKRYGYYKFIQKNQFIITIPNLNKI